MPSSVRCLHRGPHQIPAIVIRVLPDFLPEDAVSGGFRVMLFRDLRDYLPTFG